MQTSGYLKQPWESTQHGAPTAAVSADSATCTLSRCSAAKESTKSHAGISLPLSLVACPLAFPLALPLALLEPMASTPAPELHATACQMQHCGTAARALAFFATNEGAHQHTHCAPASVCLWVGRKYAPHTCCEQRSAIRCRFCTPCRLRWPLYTRQALSACLLFSRPTWAAMCVACASQAPVPRLRRRYIAHVLHIARR